MSQNTEINGIVRYRLVALVHVHGPGVVAWVKLVQLTQITPARGLLLTVWLRWQQKSFEPHAAGERPQSSRSSSVVSWGVLGPCLARLCCNGCRRTRLQ